MASWTSNGKYNLASGFANLGCVAYMLFSIEFGSGSSAVGSATPELSAGIAHARFSPSILKPTMREENGLVADGLELRRYS